MSETLNAVSPTELCKYMYEQEEKFEWETFRPYFKYLYQPSPIKAVNMKEASVNVEDKSMIRNKLHISCCSIVLYGLEFAVGISRGHQLIKEGLLDYATCLPAVLPGECQPRARSLVNELNGKHRQLQPPSLCTLAKAHIAKTFCGLQPVMEMKSIGEFLHCYILIFNMP